MARGKLSETKIKALVAAGVYGDGDGLWLRVRVHRGTTGETVSKNWVFIWRRGKERREIGLGGYGQGTAPTSLLLAREKADAVRQQLARGEDPRNRDTAKAMTFGEAMEALIKVKEPVWRNDKHADQWRMTLREYAKPLHPLAVSAVTVDDVVSCLTPHWTERPETADRLRSRIGAVLDYAKARGLRTGDNPAAWKGNLESLLSKRQKLQRGHHAALPYNRMPAAMMALRAAKGVSARAVEFTALTAARTSESREATWKEFDLTAKVWTVPPERMKAGAEHRVPLSDQAMNIIEERKNLSTGDLVFEGYKQGMPVSATAMEKALRRASGDTTVTLHGLRSAFRDWAGDMTNHPRDVAEAALAHTIQGVEAAYRRSDALAKRRSLMSDWAAYCA